MSTLTRRIEAEVARQAGVEAVVEEDQDRLVVTGMTQSEQEKQAALDIVRSLAGDRPVDDNLDVTTVFPNVEGMDLSDEDVGGFRGVEEQSEAEPSLEAGDFEDQALLHNELAAPGPTLDEPDIVDEGDKVYIPPTDPVLDRQGNIVGGFATTSMDQQPVEASAEDDQPGDEAIADAIRRELREDAATNDLEIRVAVRRGIVLLHGRVPRLRTPRTPRPSPGACLSYERCARSWRSRRWTGPSEAAERKR